MTGTAGASAQHSEPTLCGGDPLSGEDRLEEFVEDHMLDALYRSESRKLVRTLSRQTASPEEAQDLVQDVFFRLARLRQKSREPLDRPQAYLRRIAANLLRDGAKKAARRSVSLHIVADEQALPGLDQHKLLESRDMLTRLQRAMMQLRPKTREIFMAHRVEGLTYTEIAERTGLSVKGIEKQMSKALAQLDRILSRS